jgi:hypothetical protein
MRISIDWGKRNVLTAQITISEMRGAAKHLTEACEARCVELGVETLVLEVGLTLPLSTLVHNYLPPAFRFTAVPDTKTKVMYDRLVYTRPVQEAV